MKECTNRQQFIKELIANNFNPKDIDIEECIKEAREKAEINDSNNAEISLFKNGKRYTFELQFKD